MTQSINVTVGREVFEITVHVEDEHGIPLSLAPNFFRNPNLFQSCTRDLLSKLSDRANITQIDTTGIAYGTNLQAHTDITRPLWERVELCVRARVGAAMVDAEDDELNLSEIDEASDAGSDSTEEDFSTVPLATQPSLNGRTAPISLTPPVVQPQVVQPTASHIQPHTATQFTPNLPASEIIGDLADDENAYELTPLTSTAAKVAKINPRITIRRVTDDAKNSEDATPILPLIKATIQEDLNKLADYLLVLFPGQQAHS